MDIQKGIISVRNENFFKDLSNVRMKWCLLADGIPVADGTVDNLDVAPQQSRNYTLPLPLKDSYADKELLLNIDFVLKNAEPLMTSGQVVAYRQLTVSEDSHHAANDLASAKIKVKEDKKAQEVLVQTGDVKLVFDRATGFLCHYEAAGKQLLGEGGTIKPNFWRAVTDNDMGAGIQRRYRAWRNPTLKLTAFEAKKAKTKQGEKYVNVSAVYDMPEVKAQLRMDYAILPGGRMMIHETMNVADSAKVADMLRFGVVIQLPYDMDKSAFYGRGPIENYSDRKESQNVGIYKQIADEQFFPYIRPQETGTKSDMRCWKQTNSEGKGIKVSALPELFMASALHYNILDLDEGMNKKQRHPEQIKKSKFTELRIDKAQAGLGGIDSWGAWPLEQYRLKYENMVFNFTISPLK